MDNDYQNFVDRMGSFEDSLDLTDEIQHGNVKIISRNQSALKHFGILGMKWGHRKSITPSTVGAAARTGQSVVSLGQNINKGTINKKTLNKAKSLSDDELKKLTSRLELENRYINATTQQQGKQKVEGILSAAGATFAVISSAALMVDVIKKAKG